MDNCLGFDSGIEAILEIGGKGAISPIIMISGMLGKNTPEEALDSGAIAYLDKRNIQCDILEATIRSSIFAHEFEQQISCGRMRNMGGI